MEREARAKVGVGERVATGNGAGSIRRVMSRSSSGNRDGSRNCSGSWQVVEAEAATAIVTVAAELEQEPEW